MNEPTQVFNDFEYIGSTIFSLPGIKCLVGNGRNPDGSCITKNEESTKVSIYTIDATRTINKIVLYYGSAAGKLRNFRFIYAFGEI